MKPVLIFPSLLCMLWPLAGQTSGPTVASCPVFPQSNVWNANITSLQVAPQSAEYVFSIGADRPLHPDFGPGGVGIPFVAVTGGQAKARVKFDYADESDIAAYPIPSDAPIEGGADSSQALQ